MAVETWDFDYAPMALGATDGGYPESDLILATESDVDEASVIAQLAGLPDVAITPLFNAHPIFWTRIESSQPIDRQELRRRLGATGVVVRFLASARSGSQRLPPPLNWTAARPRRANAWTVRAPSAGAEPETPWRWFLRRSGVDLDRSACGTGAGTRLAVIDNDGRDLDKVDLDAEIPIGVGSVPRSWAHAGLLIGWAIGARALDGTRFRGVAPDASPRLYCIPKAGDEVFSLPLAIVRAVEDGADVILCATYVEGQTSPLLDDALEFAARVGRGGKGTAVVLPTGREMSSPPGSTHSSLSLGLTSPASDPRVFCVGPSSRDGHWFLWRDKRGKLRPFANRGPAIRWLAPGDDMALPFAAGDSPAHAESSGASGVTAGVLLLLLGTNPDLTVSDVDALLQQTLVPVDAARQASDPELADGRDLLPLGHDPDGHNAKHGYGRVSATAACAAASDPFAQALLRAGDREAALRLLGEDERPYSSALATWSARAALSDASLKHAFSTMVRAVRLSCHRSHQSQEIGGVLRQLALLARLLLRTDCSVDCRAELLALECRVREALEGDAGVIEEAILAFAAKVLGQPPPVQHSETGGRPSDRRVGQRAGIAHARNTP